MPGSPKHHISLLTSSSAEQQLRTSLFIAWLGSNQPQVFTAEIAIWPLAFGSWLLAVFPDQRPSALICGNNFAVPNFPISVICENQW
jgi:hypothetical protein